jgi:hypothetical protein
VNREPRYDLLKLRAKGLVEKLPRSRRYRLLPQGYSICLVFLKLFERIYALLTAGLLQPFSPDSQLQHEQLSQLDKLYQRVVLALDDLLHAVGLKAALPHPQREQTPRQRIYNGLTRLRKLQREANDPPTPSLRRASSPCATGYFPR